MQKVEDLGAKTRGLLAPVVYRLAHAHEQLGGRYHGGHRVDAVHDIAEDLHAGIVQLER